MCIYNNTGVKVVTVMYVFVVLMCFFLHNALQAKTFKLRESANASNLANMSGVTASF